MGTGRCGVQWEDRDSGRAEGWGEQSGLGVQGFEGEQAGLHVSRGMALARCQAPGEKLGATYFEDWIVEGQPGTLQKSGSDFQHKQCRRTPNL